MYRIAWIYMKLKHGLVRRISPWFYTRIARMKFGAMRASIGPGLWVDGRVVLSIEKGTFKAGKNLRLRSRYRGNLVGMAFPMTFQLVQEGASISIGDDCGFSSVVMSSRNEVKIGNNVILGVT